MDINPEMIGKHVIVFAMVSLTKHGHADYTAFENTVRELPETLGLFPVSGDLDYIIKFVTNDMDHYKRIYKKLTDIQLGIAHYSSYFVIGSGGFERRGYPIEMIANLP